MQRRTLVTILGLIVFGAMLIGGAVLATRYYSHHQRSKPITLSSAFPEELPQAINANYSSYIPIATDGEAGDHPAEVTKALDDFQKENPCITITSMALGKHGVYIIWKCKREYEDD
ncbi:MAG: hypothetical protein KGJ31_02485 [Patescibacteria group bacterium]|nr:hypothetical protein [Patescibacteria group bacterium]